MIYHYNPIHFSLKELEDTTVGREELLNLLFNSIKEQAEKMTHQHWLLVGPRGIGKSHLISFIYHRIKEEEGFRKKWLPILFPEQGYGIISLLDFMVKIIKLAQEEEEGWDKILEDIRGEKEIEAVEKIRTFLIEQTIKRKRKLLLLVENLDRVFGKRVTKDPYNERWLRSLLMNDNALLLIGTSPSVFKQLIDHKHAFYNLFRIEELEDFSDNDCQGLWLKRAELEGRKDFLETIKRNRALLMALSTLTGGNPRLILMLYEIALEYKSLEEIERLFYHLLEELTPYFQSRTESLSPQQEKILIAFAESPLLLTPGQISKKLHIPTNTITAQLNELMRNGFVKFVRKEKGIGALYDLEEHLFRYWHLSTTDRGLVEMFIQFISLWYSEPQLREYRKIFIHTVDTRPQYARLLEYTEATLLIFASLKRDEKLFREVIEKCRKVLELDPDHFSAFSKWGVALLELAELKHDEKYLKEALQQFIASWEIIKKEAILDHPSMIDTLLTAAWLSLRVDREPTYKRLVYELLEALPRVKVLKQIHSIFYDFLINILKLRRFKEAEEFTNELSKTPYKEEFAFLEPFKYIIQYYTEDKRIIDRISHELHKVCKEIIATIEEAGVNHGR